MVGPILAEYGRYWVCPVGLPFNLKDAQGRGMNLDELETFIERLETVERKPICSAKFAVEDQILVKVG